MAKPNKLGGYRPPHALWVGIGAALSLGTYYFYRLNRRESRTSNQSASNLGLESRSDGADTDQAKWEEAAKKLYKSEVQPLALHNLG